MATNIRSLKYGLVDTADDISFNKLHETCLQYSSLDSFIDGDDGEDGGAGTYFGVQVNEILDCGAVWDYCQGETKNDESFFNRYYPDPAVPVVARKRFEKSAFGGPGQLAEPDPDIPDNWGYNESYVSEWKDDPGNGNDKINTYGPNDVKFKAKYTKKLKSGKKEFYFGDGSSKRTDYIERSPDNQCVNTGTIYTSDGNGNFVIMDNVIASDCAQEPNPWRPKKNKATAIDLTSASLSASYCDLPPPRDRIGNVNKNLPYITFQNHAQANKASSHNTPTPDNPYGVPSNFTKTKPNWYQPSICYVCGLIIDSDTNENNSGDWQFGSQCEHLLPVVSLAFICGLSENPYHDEIELLFSSVGQPDCPPILEKLKEEYYIFRSFCFKYGVNRINNLDHGNLNHINSSYSLEQLLDPNSPYPNFPFTEGGGPPGILYKQCHPACNESKAMHPFLNIDYNDGGPTIRSINYKNIQNNLTVLAFSGQNISRCNPPVPGRPVPGGRGGVDHYLSKGISQKSCLDGKFTTAPSASNAGTWVPDGNNGPYARNPANDTSNDRTNRPPKVTGNMKPVAPTLFQKSDIKGPNQHGYDWASHVVDYFESLVEPQQQQPPQADGAKSTDYYYPRNATLIPKKFPYLSASGAADGGMTDCVGFSQNIAAAMTGQVYIDSLKIFVSPFAKEIDCRHVASYIISGDFNWENCLIGPDSGAHPAGECRLQCLIRASIKLKRYKFLSADKKYKRKCQHAVCTKNKPAPDAVLNDYARTPITPAPAANPANSASWAAITVSDDIRTSLNSSF